MLIIAFVVGLATTVIAVLIGVAAAYLGGLWDSSLNLITDVLLVIPLFPLLIIIAAYLHGGGTLVLILVHHRHRLVLHRAAAPGPGAVPAQPGLPGGGPGARRAAALHHRGRDHPHDDLADRGQLPGQRAVRGAVRAPACSSSASATPTRSAGARCCTGRRTTRPCRPASPCGRSPPGACIAVLGAAFALLNYAFDEIGNPALRPVTEDPCQARGLTPSPSRRVPPAGRAGPGGPGPVGRLRHRPRRRPRGRPGELRRWPGRVPRHRRRVRLRQVHPAVRHRPAAHPARRDHRRQRDVQGHATWSG